jgi:hypothetical protein
MKMNLLNSNNDLNCFIQNFNDHGKKGETNQKIYQRAYHGYRYLRFLERDINFKDSHGNNSLMNSTYFSDKPIFDILIANCLDLNIQNDNGDTFLMMS